MRGEIYGRGLLVSSQRLSTYGACGTVYRRRSGAPAERYFRRCRQTSEVNRRSAVPQRIAVGKILFGGGPGATALVEWDRGRSHSVRGSVSSARKSRLRETCAWEPSSVSKERCCR